MPPSRVPPIDCVATPDGGLIAMTAFPGRRPLPEPGAATADLRALRDWGATRLVTLAKRAEWARLGAPDLPAMAESAGLLWRHAPIPDMETPDAATLAAWSRLAPDLLSTLAAGGRVAMHCAAGLGRTGTMAATLLVQSGMEPSLAVQSVRAARPGAIETDAQLRFVLQTAPLLARL
ncbi:phosphatase domain-containing putative toxin [Alsobacter metallidurans]|nr:protein-tyrosine phosphatase family protein [Alsobacter metallidurans]